MKIKRYKYLLLLRIVRIMYIGFHKDNSEETNGKVIFVNILNLSYIANQFVATILYLLIGVYNSAIYSLILMPTPFLVYYFNYKRQYLLSKFLIFLYYNVIIFITFCYFSHPYLSYYFIPAIISSAIVFEKKELKYLLLINFVSFSLMLIANTGLKQYLPLYYQDTTNGETTVIILIVHINFIIGLLFVYAYYMHLKIKRLIKFNKTLKDAKLKLKNQSNDYFQFAEASSNFLKSPIYIFNTFIGKIEQGLYEKKSYEDLKPYFTVIKKSIEEEEKFINNMFDYNKIILTIPQKKSINISQIIEESLEVFKKPKANFAYTIPQDPVELKIDGGLLTKLVHIIAENAYYYNENETRLLAITYHLDKDSLGIHFKDNGIGINQSYSENIFKPYVRINKTEHVHGTGIGLLKAKKIAELIGAQFFLGESNNSGTTFQLLINTKE
ncbi:sensor histidine kinase [Epilithonimonas tenax]|uniref:sensor histidine kinase n=1 Tax=Epilithonimonas tenax TaxID=191577 RepID=UPI0004139DFE|nr:HAMP domain-containing sensor histidine kinase [Epilithonimonas tenax]